MGVNQLEKLWNCHHRENKSCFSHDIMPNNCEISARITCVNPLISTNFMKINLHLFSLFRLACNLHVSPLAVYIIYMKFNCYPFPTRNKRFQSLRVSRKSVNKRTNKSSGITMGLFSSHPPIDKQISPPYQYEISRQRRTTRV